MVTVCLFKIITGNFHLIAWICSLTHRWLLKCFWVHRTLEQDSSLWTQTWRVLIQQEHELTSPIYPAVESRLTYGAVGCKISFKPTAGESELMITLITEGKSTGWGITFQQHRIHSLNTFVKLLEKKSIGHPMLLLCSRNQSTTATRQDTHGSINQQHLEGDRSVPWAGSQAKLCTDSSLYTKMLTQHTFLHDKQVGSGQRQNFTGPFPQGETCFSARLQCKINPLKKGFQCLLVLDIHIKFTQVAKVCINDK